MTLLNDLPDNTDALQQQMQQHRLGLVGNDGAFLPAPVSLTPWTLDAALWQQAKLLADGLHLLLSQLITRPALLQQASAGLLASQSVPGALTRQLQAIGFFDESRLWSPQNHAVALMRHDFLLDTAGQWRWVESNSIAAGMGPLNQAWLNLARDVLPNATQTAAANPALPRQAAQLAAAAWAQARRHQASSACVAFVVAADEDNLYDQQLLADAITAHGVIVRRLTLMQLQQCQLDGAQRLRDADGTVLDLLYWRTGYNPADYYPTDGAFDALWQLRAQLETADVAQCPTMALQLVSSKYVQAWLSQQLLDPALRRDLAAQLVVAEPVLAVLAKTCVAQQFLTSLSDRAIQQLLDKGWWYKRQDEGGGNVARGDMALTWAKQRDAGDLLMAPIAGQVRREAMLWLRAGEWRQPTAVLSELGVFTGEPLTPSLAWSATTNETAQPCISMDRQSTSAEERAPSGGYDSALIQVPARYAGYLLRSKPAEQLEGGVHRGGAVLDLLVLA